MKRQEMKEREDQGHKEGGQCVCSGGGGRGKLTALYFFSCSAIRRPYSGSAAAKFFTYKVREGGRREQLEIVADKRDCW